MDTVLPEVTHSAQRLGVQSEGFPHQPCHFCQTKASGGEEMTLPSNKPMKTPRNWLGKNVVLNKCEKQKPTQFFIQICIVFWAYRMNSDQIAKLFLASMKTRPHSSPALKRRLWLVYKQIQMLQYLCCTCKKGGKPAMPILVLSHKAASCA